MKPPEHTESAPQEEPEANKDQHINLRVSAADKKDIQAKAAIAGLTTGEYIRRAALEKRIVEKVPTELRRQIALVGSNINQLARLANSGKLNGASTEKLNDLVTLLLQTLKW